MLKMLEKLTCSRTKKLKGTKKQPNKQKFLNFDNTYNFLSRHEKIKTKL